MICLSCIKISLVQRNNYGGEHWWGHPLSRWGRGTDTSSFSWRQRKFRVKYLISGVAVFPVVRFNIKCVPCSSKWPFPNQLIKVNLRQQMVTFWWQEAKRYCRWNPNKHLIINGSIKTLRLRASKTSFVSRISLYYRILIFSFMADCEKKRQHSKRHLSIPEWKQSK